MTEYCQVGGFKATIARASYEYDTLAQSIMRSHMRATDGSVELVLGIRTSGSSCLLLPDSDWRRLRLSIRPCGRFYSSQDFESLSPITFYSSEELCKKLATFALKTTKHRRRGFDTSQANKSFCNSFADLPEGEPSQPTPECIARVCFEHARIFRRLQTNPAFNPAKFGIFNSLSWRNSIRICSFMLSVWSSDTRNWEERQRNPRILDYGFSEADAQIMAVIEGSSKHFIAQQNQTMGQTGLAKESFRHGESKIMDEALIYTELQNLFKPNTTPMLLLVTNQQLTMTVLANANVDTSNWHFGFNDLFQTALPRDSRTRREYSRRSRSPYRSSRDYDRPHSPRREYSQISRRSRSRSPHRSSRDDSGNSHRLPVSNSGEYPAVHVIDVKQLFVTLAANEQESQTIGKMAQWLGIDSIDPGKWSAGNDAVHLFQLFRSMAEGNAVDDQRQIREEERKARIQAQANDVSNPGPGAGYDDIESDYGGSSDEDN